MTAIIDKLLALKGGVRQFSSRFVSMRGSQINRSRAIKLHVNLTKNNRIFFKIKGTRFINENEYEYLNITNIKGISLTRPHS